MGNSDDRRPYLTALVLNQAFLDNSQDNLVNQLEFVVEIEGPTGTLYFSDRNKYVGDTFYEARITLPLMKRTVGEWLSNIIEFQDLTFEINNADEQFNPILPGGADFDGWAGRRITFKMGLRDVAATYVSLFSGLVTHEGGFKRTVKSFSLTARDDFEKINQSFPFTIFTDTAFPDIEPSLVNTFIPVVYGDWTVDMEPGFASIPAIVVNGGDEDVNGDVSNTTNVQLVISEHDNVSFDSANVYLKRGDKGWLIDSGDINTIVGNRTFQITQASGTMTAVTPDTDDDILEYSTGDEFFVRMKGKDLGAYDDNIVAIARDILETFGGVLPASFDSNWDTYRDKASPAVSAIATFKARAHIREPQNALDFALSLLEQVRLEAFVDRNLKLKILPLHLEDFDPSPTHKIRNWDIEKDSFRPQIDERNNFNRAKAVYNLLPNRNENFSETVIYKNQAAIDQQGGQKVSKKIIYPNLYDLTVVQNQLIETMRLASSYLEHIYTSLTWRSLLLDIGDFVALDVKIQSSQYDESPALVREIGYDPIGVKLPVRLWSFQMTPFPGWSPGYSGITGGSTATIEED